MPLTPQWNEPAELNISSSHDAAWFNTYINENMLHLKNAPYTLMYNRDSDMTADIPASTTLVDMTEFTITHTTTKITNLLIVGSLGFIGVNNGFIYSGIKVNNTVDWYLPLNEGDGINEHIDYFDRQSASELQLTFALPFLNAPVGTYTFHPTLRTSAGTGYFKFRKHNFMAVIEL